MTVADASNPHPQGTRTGRGPILVASHERSGTHLFMDLLRRQFAPCRGRVGRFINPHDSLYFSIDRLNANHHRPGTPEECDRVLRAIERPCLKTHNTPDMERTAPEHRSYIRDLIAGSTSCYCYRDGRSVMASLQRFRQGFDRAASGAIGDFIREDHGDGRSRVRAWADHVRSWLAVPGVVAIRFEDTVKNTRSQIEQIAAALGMTPEWNEPLLPAPTRNRLEHWWSRLTGRDESTNISGRGKGLEPVKWREAFSPDDRRFFAQEAGDLLIELGYEPSHDWVEQPGGRS